MNFAAKAWRLLTFAFLVDGYQTDQPGNIYAKERLPFCVLVQWCRSLCAPTGTAGVAWHLKSGC